jgi:hypothetical protein
MTGYAVYSNLNVCKVIITNVTLTWQSNYWHLSQFHVASSPRKRVIMLVVQGLTAKINLECYHIKKTLRNYLNTKRTEEYCVKSATLFHSVLQLSP